MNGYSESPTNNGDDTSPSTSAILRALELIHSPASDNDIRREATEFLNQQKTADGAYGPGFRLAADHGHAPIVRHFGLSLIEHTIRLKWHDLTDDQTAQVRGWTLELAHNISEADPPYIRNKVAQLCVELAKKSWAVDWLDMDQVLLALWGKSLTSKEVVLTILESLSEDTFAREDSAAALRGQELNTALVEIFTPAAQFAGGLIVGKTSIHLRANDEGWLARIVEFMQECLSNASVRQVRVCLTKALATLRSVFSWMMLSAVVSTRALPAICASLSVQDTDVLMAAVQVLHALFDRSHFDDTEYKALILPMYQAENVLLLRTLYEWSIVSAQDIHSPKYPISKKFSEMVAYLSDHIEQKPASVEIDLSAFFEFMVSIVNHPSLVVSIPILHSWTKLLASTHGRISATRSVIGPLLESASRRIFRYEQLPEDSVEPAIIFVSEDIEAIPERHAFLGNYRRYCFLIVESICYLEPQDAIPFVLSTTEKALDELETHSFNLATYTKTSLTLLQADARLTVVDAALKGYSTWVAKQGKSPQKDEQTRNLLEASLENWAVTMLATRNGERHKSSPDAANSFAAGLRPAFDDPMFRQRIMKTAVEFSNRALEKKESFALKVLEYLLETQLPELPEHAVYSEAVKDLHMYATGELRRLATRHADYFSTFYDQLQAKIHEISASRDLGEKAQAELPATLLIIMQRAKNIDPSLRRQRLVSFVDPITEAWKSPQLSQNLSTIENFARFMAFDKVVQYLRSRNANLIPDWAATALEARGGAIRDEGTERYSQLPLRLTKTLLAVSVDKSVTGTPPYQIACALWSPVIPVVLPNLLRLVSYAHKLHDPRNWPDLPTEMQSIVARVLQDRFWQAGISGGTMNEFYATIAITKASLEGFASATRGKIRNIREACYNIIYSMSRLGEVFYGYEGLSGPLAEALFASASFLSPHNFSILLDMAKRLIDDCPPSQYRLFLIPVLSTLFRQMDQKCSEEWAALDRRKAVSTNGEDLTDEMRAESILRQLCYKSVMLVASLLDPLRDQRAVEQQPLHNSDDLTAINAPKSSLRDFLLSELTILEPLLLFCAHAITYRDTRANTVVTRTLRSVVPHFATPEGRHDATSTAIREFIASDVLKAAITSLHDGYFADVQKDTAGLIATIWIAYGLPTHVAATTSEDGLQIQPAHDRPPLTESVRNLLLRLPGMTEQRVDTVGVKLGTTGGVTGSNRQQRALILVLMEGLRGVRISELGKFDRDEAKEKSKLQEKYMQRESMGMAGVEEGGQRVDIDGEGLEELGAVAGLFG